MASYNVRCESCGTLNSVPADKEGRVGRCGKCHSPLPPMYYRPQQLSEQTFDNFINSYDGVILAEFWAPW